MIRKNFSDISVIKWLFAKSKNQLIKISLLILGNIIYAGSVSGFAVICKQIIDGTARKNREQIISYGILLFITIVFQFILRISLNSGSEYIRSTLAINYRQEIFSSILNKKYKNISKYHSGELINRLFSDLQIISDGIVTLLPSFFNILVRIISTGVILIIFDKNFIFLFLIGGIFSLVASNFFRSKLKRLHKEVQEKSGILRSFIQETLEKIVFIKMFSSEKKISNISTNLQHNLFSSQMKRRNISIVANAGFSFFFEFGYLLGIIWGSFKVYNGDMTYGTLMAILQLILQLRVPFASLSGFLPKIYSIFASAERLMEIESIENEEILNRKLKYEDFKSVEIKDLSFKYEDNIILNSVNMNINKGDFISITGVSGGGKSTLFLLLAGIHQPNSGTINFYGNNEIFSAGAETRDIFGYVPQGNQLFSGTIRENISFLNDKATLEEIEKVAKIACIDEFINSLPDRYDTPIGENGLGISEGQAQRIAIARTLLSGCNFLLLDEATSALDENTEAEILKNIGSLKNKTCIIVTHRKSALKICNRNYLFTNQSIREIFY